MAGSSEAAAAPGMRGTTAAVASWALVETGMKREEAACLCAVVASDALACVSTRRVRFAPPIRRKKAATRRWSTRPWRGLLPRFPRLSLMPWRQRRGLLPRRPRRGCCPWWFPRRGLLPWRPRTEEVPRSSSNNHRVTAAAASDHAAFGRQHTRRRTAAGQYAKPHKHLRVRRGGTSRATRIPAAAIQNSGSHSIGIARRSDFWATWPAAPVPPRPDCYNRCRRGLTISCVSTFRFWYNFLEKKRFWYNLYM